ncbi:TetR/AcrR family transcriptional regulator [Aeromicrobium wangtongii]|uniref:TetR/AcrR family transcriptional regulator n=1 Tax=Aeromicrobium wangtongii TaxID=2969247 RepID=UPI0020177E47|nr:TetR/AcrR family transcriptional regulator [Aeromicrobium wangtongii]MCL3819840.1 TetR/AcrR family transcriptional regulator [Aeromicrobium wangtongii]
MSPAQTKTTPSRKAGSDRRSELIQIASELFAERGFLATTIRDIADAAGIQSGSLYHHFTSKESMVEELLTDYWTTLLENYRAVVDTETDATEAARGLVRASVLLLDECALALRVMLNDWAYLSETFPFMEERLAECQTIWLDVLERGVASGAMTSSVEPTILYRTVMSSVSGTARWFRPDGPVSVEKLADEMATLFMNGIAARP